MTNICLLRCLVWTLLLVYAGIGYGVVPVLFAQLTSHQAGELAGVYLNVAHAVIFFGSVAIWFGLRRFSQRLKTTLTFGVQLSVVWVSFSSLTQWMVISPKMLQLKAESLQLTGHFLSHEDPLWSTFAMWHGISQALYLSTLIALAFLLWRLGGGRGIK